MSGFQIKAPGKLNLCLYLGATRTDGLHEIASLFESVSLHDTITMSCLPSGEEDRVTCAGVEGENLALTALSLARTTGRLTGPPIELTITKRVPVAAGMGGGSADAAAVLRMVAELERTALDELRDIAFDLGADVPSQLIPGPTLVGGAGELVEPIGPELLAAARRAYVIVAQTIGLSTADVFREADRMGLQSGKLPDRSQLLRDQLQAIPTTDQLCAAIENDLTPAIVALRPDLAELPREIERHGAKVAEFTGSGPTCFGVFEEHESALRAAEALQTDGYLAHAAVPVSAEFAACSPAEVSG